MNIREAIDHLKRTSPSKLHQTITKLMPEWLETIFKELNLETYISLSPDEKQAVNKLYSKLSETKARMHPELVKTFQAFQAFQEELEKASSKKRCRDDSSSSSSRPTKKPKTHTEQTKDDIPILKGVKRDADRYDTRASKKQRIEERPSLLPNPWALVEDSVIDTQFDLLSLQGVDPVKKEEAIRRVRDFIKTFDKENPSTLDLKNLQLQKLPICFYTDPMFSHIEISGNSIAIPQDLLIKEVRNADLYRGVLTIQENKEMVFQDLPLSTILSFLPRNSQLATTSKGFQKAIRAEQYNSLLHDPELSQYMDEYRIERELPSSKIMSDRIKSARNAYELDQSLNNMFRTILHSLPPDIQEAGASILSTAQSIKQKAISIRTFLEEHAKICATIQSLRFKRHRLTVLPPEIRLFKNLSFLDLSHNNLTKFPNELLSLQNLRGLLLDSNEIESLPANIGTLNQLISLELSHNKIGSLPAEIGLLINLTSLNLYNNKLTSLPEKLGSLTKLEYLILAYNQLESIPPSIGRLTELTNLYLTNNKLTSLPEQIRYLNRLRTIYLEQNSISATNQALIRSYLPYCHFRF